MRIIGIKSARVDPDAVSLRDRRTSNLTATSANRCDGVFPAKFRPQIYDSLADGLTSPFVVRRLLLSRAFSLSRCTRSDEARGIWCENEISSLFRKVYFRYDLIFIPYSFNLRALKSRKLGINLILVPDKSNV